MSPPALHWNCDEDLQVWRAASISVVLRFPPFWPRGNQQYFKEVANALLPASYTENHHEMQGKLASHFQLWNILWTLPVYITNALEGVFIQLQEYIPPPVAAPAFCCENSGFTAFPSCVVLRDELHVYIFCCKLQPRLGKKGKQVITTQKDEEMIWLGELVFATHLVPWLDSVIHRLLPIQLGSEFPIPEVRIRVGTEGGLTISLFVAVRRAVYTWWKWVCWLRWGRGGRWGNATAATADDMRMEWWTGHTGSERMRGMWKIICCHVFPAPFTFNDAQVHQWGGVEDFLK